MERITHFWSFVSLLFFLSSTAKSPFLCEGRSTVQVKKIERGQVLKQHMKLDLLYTPMDSSPSPFAPSEYILGPSSSPRDFPPFCVFGPPLPLTPLPHWLGSPPPPGPIPKPSPPEGFPGFEPAPPEYSSGPPVFVPGPPLFLPPLVYPPPNGPPPPHASTTPGLWCVAKPTVPDPIIQEAMNYACGSGADCDAIQPAGSCYQPDTLIAHASFAFNSYWQRTKVAGGTCDFGGTAILITRDPSYDECHFLIN